MKNSNHVFDTYANEDQEDFSHVQEALSENELQEDYNRSHRRPRTIFQCPTFHKS